MVNAERVFLLLFLFFYDVLQSPFSGSWSKGLKLTLKSGGEALVTARWEGSISDFLPATGCGGASSFCCSYPNRGVKSWNRLTTGCKLPEKSLRVSTMGVKPFSCVIG